MKKRKEINEKYKWDLSPLCKNDEEFNEKLEKAKIYISKFKKFEGKLNNKETILKFLMLEREFCAYIDPLILYSSMRLDEELSNSKHQLMSEKLNFFLNDFHTQTSFASSELNELSDEFLDQIIKDKDFADFDRDFKHIKKNKKHKLSKAEEKLIVGMDFLGGFSNNMRQLSDIDFDFGEIEDEKGVKHKFSQSLYGKFMRSFDRVLRKNAFIRMNGTFGKCINMLSSNYINEIKSNCYFSKVRKYKNVLSSALEGEEVSEKVYFTLIEMVRENLPLLFDYYKLKQKEKILIIFIIKHLFHI